MNERIGRVKKWLFIPGIGGFFHRNMHVIMEKEDIKIRRLVIASLIAGFLLIPVHELGHVICDWVTGNPAAMSYARDYLLSGEEPPFLGVLGGPVLPLLLAAISVMFIYMKKDLSVFYPIAILGSIDRLILYLIGTLPSDERNLANMAGWNIQSFKYIFLSLEVAILLLVIISFFTNRISLRKALLAVFVPLLGFVAGAAIGIFIIERYVFPAQYALQFGG